MLRLLILLFALIVCCPAYSAEKYVAAYPENVPPYYIQVDGVTTGFGIELVKALAGRLDLQLEYRQMPDRQATLGMIRSGKAQIIPNTIVSNKRSNLLLFTEPYNSSPVAVVTRRDRYDINSLYDLSNHKVGYQQTNINMDKLSHIRNVHFIKQKNEYDLMMMLLTSKIDAIFYHVKPIMELAESMGIEDQIKILEPVVYHSVRAIAVSSKYPELYAQINNELISYMQTEEYAELFKKWHSVAKPIVDLEKLILVFSIVLAVTVVVLVTWRILSLKQKNNELEIAKAALEDSDRKFRALAVASNDIIIFCATDYSEVYFVSDAYSKLCGVSTDKFTSDPLSMRKCIDPDDRQMMQPLSLQMKTEHTGSKLRLINQHSGYISWVILRDYIFIDEDSGLNMLAIVASDVTSLVRANEEAAAQEAVMIQQAKYVSMGEMIRSITHQWKQPLNALYICNQLMLEEVSDSGDDTMKEYLETSTELIDHMISTTEDFRSFFSSQDHKESFDAFATTLSTLKLVEPQIRSKNISYHISCQCANHSYNCLNNIIEKDHTCSYAVHGKQNEFKHAIINIIQNAREELDKLSMHNKQISVQVHCNGGFSMTISDNGSGIRQDMLEKIFNPDITMKKDGSGLGLHLTKKIIEGMNGKVWAENSGSGATFRIELPVTDAAKL